MLFIMLYGEKKGAGQYYSARGQVYGSIKNIAEIW